MTLFFSGSINHIGNPLLLLVFRCDGCQMFPINGPRFKCRNCDDFDYCDSCFKTSKHNTRHSFGRINEPGGGTRLIS